jgi:hypothetical protein
MAAKKGTHTEQIDALTRHVARLGRRIKALEDQRYRELTSAIGFEIESVEVEVDDEELPEMTATLVRRRR